MVKAPDPRSDYAVVLWFLASLELTFVAFGPRDLRFLISKWRETSNVLLIDWHF